VCYSLWYNAPTMLPASGNIRFFVSPCIISQAQNATAFQPDFFLTEIQRCLFSHKVRSAFYDVNYCQGQLKSPQSLSIEPSRKVSGGRQQLGHKTQGYLLISGSKLVITNIIKNYDNC